MAHRAPQSLFYRTHGRPSLRGRLRRTRFRWLEVAALLVLLGQRGWGCYGDLVGQFSLPLSIRLCLCIFIICELILLVYCCKLFLYNTLSQFTCVNMGLLFILLIHALLCSCFQFCFVYQQFKGGRCMRKLLVYQRHIVCKSMHQIETIWGPKLKKVLTTPSPRSVATLPRAWSLRSLAKSHAFQEFFI